MNTAHEINSLVRSTEVLIDNLRADHARRTSNTTEGPAEVKLLYLKTKMLVLTLRLKRSQNHQHNNSELSNSTPVYTV